MTDNDWLTAACIVTCSSSSDSDSESEPEYSPTKSRSRQRKRKTKKARNQNSSLRRNDSEELNKVTDQLGHHRQPSDDNVIQPTLASLLDSVKEQKCFNWM